MKGFVYKLTCEESPNIYIGSTVDTLNQRLSKHKNLYKRYLDNKAGYCSAYEIVKHPSCKIELLESIEINDDERFMLKILEDTYLEVLKDQIINKNRAFGHDKIKYKENRRLKYLQQRNILVI